MPGSHCQRVHKVASLLITVEAIMMSVLLIFLPFFSELIEMSKDQEKFKTLIKSSKPFQSLHSAYFATRGDIPKITVVTFQFIRVKLRV